MVNKFKTLALVPAAVVAMSAPAFAAASAQITQATDDVTAINTAVGTISTAAVTVVGALLGAALLAWAGRIAFKAMSKGFN